MNKKKKSVVIVFLPELDKKTKRREKTKTICKFCGYHYSDFKEIGFLGCPECYKSFYPYIIKYLKEIHRSIEYKGKIPVRFKNEKN